MAVQSYTIYLLKEEITSFEAARNPRKTTQAFPLRSDLPFRATLFVGEQYRKPPSWASSLQPFLQDPISSFFVAGVSAILLVAHEERIFAVSFGYGRNLLNGSCWVQDFGLRVTLNRVDPARLRSIDARTYEDLVLLAKKQTSRSAALNNFQLDIGRDLVSAVVGEPTDRTFFRKLAGADSLKLTTELRFSHLNDLLDELLVAYSDTRYRNNFEWIDHIKQVDATTKDQLDGLLISSLRQRNVDQMHLAPADIVEWETIDGFNYTWGPRSVKYLELDLGDYISILDDQLDTVTVDQLKRHKVRVWLSEGSQLVDRWSVYECIVWETEHDGRRYVILNGRWFEIDLNYSERVAAFVADASKDVLGLPDAIFGDDEQDYNETVASLDPSTFALLDRELFKPSAAASTIEFCDLLSNRGQFIHVKKRSSSATLSHLFSQGAVSCELFLQDPGLRAQVRSNLAEQTKPEHEALFPDTRPVPSAYEVVFVVISKEQQAWPPPLPFFSAVNFMHHASRIRNLDFSVKLQHVRQRQGP